MAATPVQLPCKDRAKAALKSDFILQLSARAVFVVGPDKKLKLSILYPATTGRNFNEVRGTHASCMQRHSAWLSYLAWSAETNAGFQQRQWVFA